MRHYSPPKKKKKYAAGSDHEYVAKKKNGEQEEESTVDTMEEEREEEEGDGDGGKKKKQKSDKEGSQTSGRKGKVYMAKLNPHNASEIWVRAKAGTSREAVLADPQVKDLLVPGIKKLLVVYFSGRGNEQNVQFDIQDNEIPTAKTTTIPATTEEKTVEKPQTTPEKSDKTETILTEKPQTEKNTTVSKQDTPLKQEPVQQNKKLLVTEMKYSVDEKGRVVITGPNGEEAGTDDAFRFIKYKLKTDKDFRKQFYKNGEDKTPVFVVKRKGKDFPIKYEFAPPPVVVEEKIEEKQPQEAVKEEPQPVAEKQPEAVPATEEKDFLTEAWEFLKKYAGEIGEVAISLLPVVGDVYDVLVALLGKSPLTGEKLDWTDRLLSLAGVLPIPFVSGKLLRYGKRAVEWVLDQAYIQKLVKEYIPKALAWMKEQWEKVTTALAGLGFGTIKKNTPVKLNRAIINGLEIAKRKLNYIEAKSFGKTIYKGPIDLGPTLDRIKKGDIGPHIYKNDGVVFKNKEGLLPAKWEGYYKEYFVPLTNVQGVPPTRILIGESGEIWFSSDHYKTFIKLN